MATRRGTVSSRQFAAWIRGHIARMRPGDDLPTDATLAGQWGLSQKTVAGVMRALAVEGLIVRTRGKGTSVAGAIEQKLPPSPNDAAQNLAGHICQAIQSGRIRVGDPLPPVTSLSREQGVSAHTVIAAYRQLLTEGLIHRVGRVHRCGPFRLTHPASSARQVTVIAQGPDDMESLFADRWYGRAYHEFEDECARHGLLVSYTTYEGFAVARSPGIETIGIVCAETAHTRRQPHPTNPLCVESIRRCMRTHKVLLDIKGITTVGRPPSTFIRRRPRGTTYLYRPYLSQALRESLVSLVCARGLRQVMVIADAGRTRGVAVGPSPAPNDGRLSAHPPFWTLSDLLRFRERVARKAPQVRVTIAVANARTRAERSRIEQYIGSGADADVNPPVYAFIDTLGQHTSGIAQADLVVVGTDALAADLLSTVGPRSPISSRLVSLDNDPRFYHLGLSRCEIDWHNLGYLMAHALMGDIPVAVTSEGYLEPVARVVEKRTSRGVGTLPRGADTSRPGLQP